MAKVRHSFLEIPRALSLARVRGVMVPLMSLGDLIRMKRLAGRDRDRADIECLKTLARYKIV